MRASLVYPHSGKAVCAIDSSEEPDPLTIGRQAQFGIRDAACSRRQARLELRCGTTNGDCLLNVECVGAGRLSVDVGGRCRQLAVGEAVLLADGDSLTLGASCRLVVQLQRVAAPDAGTSAMSTPPAAKRTKLDIPDVHDAGVAAESKDTDEEPKSAAEVERQLEIMRQTAARFASQSERSADDSGGASQSESQPIAAAGWQDLGTALVYTTAGCQASAKIASFDLDGTLICTASGRVFPRDAADWRIIYPEVPGRLKSLFADGYKVVLFSNQKGVQAGKVKVDELKLKVERITARLGVPLQAFLSIRGLRHRKPCSGMWRLLQAAGFNCGVQLRLADCFYVGDAAGRPAEPQKGGRKADFSCSDRLFAINCGLPPDAFHTPEEFFLRRRRPNDDRRGAQGWRMPELCPARLLAAGSQQQPEQQWSPPQELQKLLASTAEWAQRLVLVLVGYPASGKSTLCRHLLAGQQRDASAHSRCRLTLVSRDQLGTWQRCMQVAERALSSATAAAADGVPVVLVDNTNVDAESRARYVDLARRHGAVAACLLMSSSLAQCLHNERYRTILEEEAIGTNSHNGHQRREPISEMVFNQMRARWSEPQLSEGFQHIITVPFVPSFRCDAHRRLYSEYLVEK